MIHELKIKREYADAICGEVKNFEVRKNDRNFQPGDIVIFKVVDEDGCNPFHTIDNKAFFIPYVLTHDDFPDGIAKDFCVFAITPLSDNPSYYYTHLRGQI